MSPPHALSGFKLIDPLRRCAAGRGASLFLLLAALAPAGCLGADGAPDGQPERAAGAASPIQGGYHDSADEAVAGVARRDEKGRIERICSGTFIAPNLILTAQHCVAASPSRIACDSARFGEADDPATLYATVCDSLKASCAAWLPVREVLRPPGDDAVCGNDVALVMLDAPVPSDQADPLTPRLDEPPVAGEVYSAVGFGRTGGEERDSGFRRRRDGLEVACFGAGCGTPARVTNSEWRGERGACKGDSGGPALDANGAVIGVDSRGLPGCERPIYSGLTAHRNWIVAEGARAAILGGYEAPAWVHEGTAGAAR